jgi:hypothetical protein
MWYNQPLNYLQFLYYTYKIYKSGRGGLNTTWLAGWVFETHGLPVTLQFIIYCVNADVS